MKKVLVMILAMAVLMSVSATAQDSEERNAYLGGGVNIPLNALEETHELGFNGMARISVRGNSRFEFLFGMDYFTFQLDGPDSLDGGTFSNVIFAIDVKINLLPDNGSSISPFVFFGPVLSNTFMTGIVPSGTEQSSLDTQSRTMFGGEFGGGFETDRFFILAKAVNSFDSGSDFNFIPIQIGVRF